MMKKGKRERTPLLVQEQPVLSDQMPSSPEKSNAESRSKGKKGWKRWFGRKQDQQENLHSQIGGVEVGEHSLNLNDLEEYYIASGNSAPNSTRSSSLKQTSSSASSLSTPAVSPTQYTMPHKMANDYRGKSSRLRSQHSTDKRDDCTDSATSSKDLSANETSSTEDNQSPSRLWVQPPRSNKKQSSSSGKHKHRHSGQKAIRDDEPSSPHAYGQKKLEEQLVPMQTQSSNAFSFPLPSSQSSSLTPKSNGEVLSPEEVAVKNLLSRPFGRENLSKNDKAWVVLMSSAEWDAQNRNWKYRVSVQKRMDINGHERVHAFTNGATFRSLPDFVWLERALRNEFHGALLVPSLEIAIGTPDLENNQYEVDHNRLAAWLSDILNGIRGHGEFKLPHSNIDLISSESMEAFLYRNSEQLHQSIDVSNPLNCSNSVKADNDDDEPNEPSGLWRWAVPELCVGCKPLSSPSSKNGLKLPLAMGNCSSRALGGAASFEIKNSFAEFEAEPPLSSSLAVHTELLEAERELVLSWRGRALRLMEKLRVLTEQEKNIGLAWRRFAVSIQNLLTCEKEMEIAKLGDSKSKRELISPYRKLQKAEVENRLRILGRHKLERTIPGLEVLDVMLGAYVADLSTVSPSVDAHLEGVKKLSESMPQQNQRPSSPSTIADQVKAGLMEMRKQFAVNMNDHKRSDDDEIENNDERMQQWKSYEYQVLQNEVLLRESLNSFCQLAPVRTGRMAHHFFNIELQQCRMLHAAGKAMRNEVAVATKDVLGKMINQHHIEIKEDQATELQLVQRIVHIGSNKKFIKEDGNATEVESGVELGSDVQAEEAAAAKRRVTALQLCKERIGRWDPKLALAIMEAVGVDDANVRVEETTRDLRMIRKYVINLRDLVDRCMEALEFLRKAIAEGTQGHIREVRQLFYNDMQDLFSGTYVPDRSFERTVTPSRGLLLGAGIDTADPSGWKTLRGSPRSGSCGEAAARYFDVRDARIDRHLSNLSELILDYNNRVEAFESFVYMECVGIQLEKHFSQRRATALSAFEKKTDITSAINIATRKRMPRLVDELQAKLDAVGADVSHTTVKEAKEAHLESKTLKSDLHDLAVRRLTRTRESSTERVVAILTEWSREEETCAYAEMSVLSDVVKAIESSFVKNRAALSAANKEISS